MIVRGAVNVPINIGGLAVPSNAKLNLYKVQAVFQPIAYVPIVDIPSGSGNLRYFLHKEGDHLGKQIETVSLLKFYELRQFQL